ncbi:hypothetical protein FHW89_002794 [Mucilaginibacter sp. SG564]|nr:hypothetical protein [Mucilaginibacter sp. SG564]
MIPVSKFYRWRYQYHGVFINHVYHIIQSLLLAVKGFDNVQLSFNHTKMHSLIIRANQIIKS